MVQQPGVEVEKFVFSPIRIPDGRPTIVKAGESRLNFAITDVIKALKAKKAGDDTALKELLMSDEQREIAAKYPYPPKGCSEATIAISAMKAELEAWQKKKAAGATDRVGTRWIGYYEDAIGKMEAWRSTNNCEVQEKQAADQSLLDTASNIITTQKEKAVSASGSLTKSKNWIYWGVAGLAVLAVVVVLVKKASK